MIFPYSLAYTLYSVLMSHKTGVCQIHGCIVAASKVLSNLDKNVDPCKDFYRFACGGWLDRHGRKDYESVLSQIRDDVNLELIALLEKTLDDSEPPFVKMIKEFYDTCMDLEAIENTGSEPLKEILKSLGGWPIVEGSNWNDSNFDWIQMLASFRKTGFSHNILISLSVVKDYKNKTVHIIKLDETILYMDRTHLLNGLYDFETSAYFQRMVKSAILLGADEKTVEVELLEALQFEIALANLTMPSKEKKKYSKFYNKYTVAELQETIPQIPWLNYFNGLLSDEIHENETLIVSVPEFLKNFAELISKTDNRVVANYMLWRAVDYSIKYLSRNWRDVGQKFLEVLYGKSFDSPRKNQCIDTVTEYLGTALSSYYVRHYFREETKVRVSEIVKYIRKEFLNILEENDWMDEKTKEQAIAKANSMNDFVAYPAELLNDTAVMEIYQDLAMTNVSYFETILKLRKWSTDYEFSKLRKPNIRGDWKKHAGAIVVNAFHNYQENSIEIPAAVLQNAFYRNNLPSHMNFGGIGFVIGHEITHGYDDTGRKFDKYGNKVNWWAKRTKELFKNKTQCIIDQYSSYTAENGMKVDGVNTQNENIADNGGLKAAYWAYQTSVKEMGRDLYLPGLNYTHNQMFWISAASIFCAKYGPTALEGQINDGVHSPEQFRINGAMSNLAEFAKDFNCSPDSAMNKKTKCRVW